MIVQDTLIVDWAKTALPSFLGANKDVPGGIGPTQTVEYAAQAIGVLIVVGVAYFLRRQPTKIV
jgi:hypothetical protein